MMGEYDEDDFLMLSGIQHFAFCKRQWALIHIEQQWQENEHTVEGELLHKRAHDTYLSEKRKDVIISRGIPVHSRKMGVNGVCDIVEFRKAEEGIKISGHNGFFQLYPVEYKKGSPKDTNIDILQLVAQIMCLEEMLYTVIPEGAIYYAGIRRREKVAVTDDLRKQVTDTFAEMHQYYDRKYTPKVKWSKRCNGCSLKEICIPSLGKVPTVQDYIKRMTQEEDQ